MERPDLSGEVRIHYVRVTNKGSVDFTDRHDGVPVTLAPGKADNLPLDMAAHFFGDITDPEAMFRHICRRQGWNTPAFGIVQPSGKTLAQEKYESLEIKPVAYRMVEVKQDTDKPIPADKDIEDIPDILPPTRRGKAGAA